MNTRLEGKEIRQGNGFEYLGGTLTGDGKSEDAIAATKPHAKK